MAERGIIIYMEGSVLVNGKRAHLYQHLKDCKVVVKDGVAVIQLSNGNRVVLSKGDTLRIASGRPKGIIKVERRRPIRGLSAIWEALKKGWYVRRLRQSRRIPVCISTVSP